MAEARITEFFGETHTDGRSVRISRGSLGFHGIGVVHAKGSLEVALPPTSSFLLVQVALPRRLGLALGGSRAPVGRRKILTLTLRLHGDVSASSASHSSAMSAASFIPVAGGEEGVGVVGVSACWLP